MHWLWWIPIGFVVVVGLLLMQAPAASQGSYHYDKGPENPVSPWDRED